jgi:acetoin utilization protein AcuC
VFIGADGHRRASYGSNHPLGIPRVSLTTDLITPYGALREEEFLASRVATADELAWFHDPDYIAAMRRCESSGKVEDRYRKRHNIGNFENPFFPDFFTTPASATGGSIQAADTVLAGRVAFNPAGGMHHAMPDQARGFCFFNDPVLAILRLRQAGMRVLYLDIDAHHGDGVEFAFRDDPDVTTCSLHMDTSYAYPFEGGRIEDIGPLGNAVNLPLPHGVNDSEYRMLFERIWPALLSAATPEAVVLQAGTDILRPDPLGKFEISTQLFLEVVGRVVQFSPTHPDGTPRLLVTGGGGYHPLALARCWAGVWALLSGRHLPADLPDAARDVLRAVDWDLDEDEPHFERFFASRVDDALEGPVRPEVLGRVGRLLDRHPLFGIRP